MFVTSVIEELVVRTSKKRGCLFAIYNVRVTLCLWELTRTGTQVSIV